MYFDQLKQQKFRYKRIKPIQYFEHLKAHWVFLDEKQIDKFTKKFKRRWESEDRITAFAIRMDLEQATLNDDDIIISDVNKNIHFMLQIWESNIFTQDMMTEWTIKAPADKLYANAVTFFNEKISGIEAYEAASGNTSDQNDFSKANSGTDLVSRVLK